MVSRGLLWYSECIEDRGAVNSWTGGGTLMGATPTLTAPLVGGGWTSVEGGFGQGSGCRMLMDVKLTEKLTPTDSGTG